MNRSDSSTEARAPTHSNQMYVYSSARNLIPCLQNREWSLSHLGNPGLQLTYAWAKEGNCSWQELHNSMHNCSNQNKVWTYWWITPLFLAPHLYKHLLLLFLMRLASYSFCSGAKFHRKEHGALTWTLPLWFRNPLAVCLRSPTTIFHILLHASHSQWLLGKQWGPRLMTMPWWRSTLMSNLGIPLSQSTSKKRFNRIGPSVEGDWLLIPDGANHQLE